MHGRSASSPDWQKLGIDMTEAADLVIGTSSGATAAAQVRSGIPPAKLLAPILSELVPPVGPNRQGPPPPPMAAIYERMRAIGAAATSAVDLFRAMGAFGLECDATLGPTAAEQRRAMVAARLPHQQWPDRPMIVAAVNAHTGGLVAFDRESGVDLVDAVTAGTALPGTVPTHKINGTRYINGGVHPAKTPTLPRAMRTSWCSRRLAGGAGRYRRPVRGSAWITGARTLRARSRPCASRVAA